VLERNPLPALIVPRPIAWVSSINGCGEANLAPFSHFNLVSIDPPMLMFAPNSKNGAGTQKDTLRNLIQVPEFVVSVVSWDLRAEMNATSESFSYGVSEFEAIGLDSAPSINVRPMRVAKAKAALECKVAQIVDLPRGHANRQSHVVIGEIVGIYIADDVIVNGKVDAVLLAPVSRLGYFDYTVVREIFQMPRPDKGE
jgi:flavin reductase (DIM6/NTAB) family NADH-FMN oxidoreductase RutF